MNGIPKPKSDYERRIAELIDSKLSAPDNRHDSVIAEIVMSVPFDMSIEDTQFLFDYANWKHARLKEKSARGVGPQGLKRNE